MTLRRFFKNNGLSSILFAIFAMSIIGMSIAGWLADTNERHDHHQPAQSYRAYVTGGSFVEAVFENWESEFLQMWALVVLTVFLYQKGSADSKPLRGAASQDTASRYAIIRARSWRQRGKGVLHGLYAHSLGLALLVLFIASFMLHAIGGTSAYNETALLHGGKAASVFEYVMSSQFWFESLQNWQSEFLAVGTLLLLSIYLRERGSEQSKPVGKKYNKQTGG